MVLLKGPMGWRFLMSEVPPSMSSRSTSRGVLHLPSELGGYRGTGLQGNRGSSRIRTRTVPGVVLCA